MTHVLMITWRDGKPYKTLVPEPRRLTADECAHIQLYETCPDCKSGYFFEGPRGGCGVNVRCSNNDCRHEFCLTFWHGVTVVHGDQIDRDMPDLYGGRLKIK